MVSYASHIARALVNCTAFSKSTNIYITLHIQANWPPIIVNRSLSKSHTSNPSVALCDTINCNYLYQPHHQLQLYRFQHHWLRYIPIIYSSELATASPSIDLSLDLAHVKSLSGGGRWGPHESLMGVINLRFPRDWPVEINTKINTRFHWCLSRNNCTPAIVCLPHNLHH